MRFEDLTLEEREEFKAEIEDLRTAVESLERCAERLEGRNNSERAHRLRGLAQSVDAQVYLIIQDGEASHAVA